MKIKMLTACLLIAGALRADPAYYFTVDADTNFVSRIRVLYPYPALFHVDRGAVRYRLVVSQEQYDAGFDALDPAEKVSLMSDAESEYAIAEAARQAAKSPLHKAADNALISVLIRGGLVASNTVALAEGTYDAVAAQLLAQEVADPTNETIQVLSGKLDRLRGVIEREGGHPDDAAIHAEE